MSHVDDGRLHAYLDGALPGGLEARTELEDHLRLCEDCRVLLEAARAERNSAASILELTRPEDVAIPPFETLLTRRANDEPAGSNAVQDRSSAQRFRSLAWAATVVLALGGGWVARGLLLGPAGEGRAGANVALSEAQSPSDVGDVGDVEQETDLVEGTDRISAVEDEPTNPERAVQAALPEPQGPEELQRAAEAAAGTVAPDPEPDTPPQVEERELAARDAVADPGGYVQGRVADAVAAPSAAEPRARAVEPARPDGLGAAQSVQASTDELRLQEETTFADQASIESPLSEREQRADELGAWRPTNPAEATRRLGRVPLQLEDLPWERMDLAEVEGTVLLRTYHPVEGDRLVELIQGPLGSFTDTDFRQGNRLESFDSNVSARAAIAVERDGVALILRGLDDREFLESLLPLIR